MSKENERLKELEHKIDDLSMKTLESFKITDSVIFGSSKAIAKMIKNFHELDVQAMGDFAKVQTKLTTDISHLETRFQVDIVTSVSKLEAKMHDEAEERDKRLQHFSYYRGLIMGLVLGIVGNLFASYLIKVLEIFGIPFWGWATSMILALTVTLLLIWILNRHSKKNDGNLL